MIEGDMPNRAQNLIVEWAKRYKDDLLSIWNQQGFKQLPGLE
jgi:hypothetical protein